MAIGKTYIRHMEEIFAQDVRTDSPRLSGPLVTPAMVTLHHLANSIPLCCDLCREQIGWTWEFAAPTGMVYCSSCKDAPPGRLTRAASSERKEFQ